MEAKLQTLSPYPNAYETHLYTVQHELSSNNAPDGACPLLPEGMATMIVKVNNIHNHKLHLFVFFYILFVCLLPYFNSCGSRKYLQTFFPFLL